MRHALLVAAAGFMSVSACIPTVTDDLATVARPRLLAVATTPAEAAPAAAVTFTALVAAPPDVRTPAVDWELCLDRKPLTELGAVSEACLGRGADGSVEQTAGRGDEVTGAVPREACSLFGPNPPPPKAGQTGGRPVDPDPTGGYYQPIVAFLADAPTLGAVRLNCGVPGLSPDERVEFGSRYRVNENPRIDTLRLDGSTVLMPDGDSASVSLRRGTTVTLKAEWASCPRKSVCGDGICGEREDATSCADDCPAGVSKGCTGAETYAWFDAVADQIVDRREGIAVTWYATAGDFSERRTGVSESDPDEARAQTMWTAPSKAGADVVWAVIRDDRGGVTWSTYRIDVR
ncbi:MAG TPA: hypothetical protein VH062_06845 [Polyangiaceae bacterium]|nr:hypothetical protein [Polyangiaceae bacterium]